MYVARVSMSLGLVCVMCDLRRLGQLEGIFIFVCCSVDLQEQLRRENETYLRDHPELKKILAHYMARGRSILLQPLSNVWSVTRMQLSSFYLIKPTDGQCVCVLWLLQFSRRGLGTYRSGQRPSFLTTN